jgi:hypothetical protein
VCFGELIPAFSGFFSWERDVEMLHRIFWALLEDTKRGRERKRERKREILLLSWAGFVGFCIFR